MREREREREREIEGERGGDRGGGEKHKEYQYCPWHGCTCIGNPGNLQIA